MNTIRLDRRGICINGTYHILMVSSLFYFRIPRAEWDSRMKLLKSAGYHAIDVYFPWNYHETEPGVWDFEGEKDVNAFLELARENRLWVIARPGPYICSEWDGGGIPVWNYLKELRIRQNDPAFLGELWKWYERILHRISPFQWTRQGTVLMLQMENELDYFPCEEPTAYMGKLAEMARRADITVPLIACCGQDNITGSGGDAAGIVPAFNIYADPDNGGLEERTRYLCGKMRERGMPLLVTETNREHAWLKRLLGCGAKMVSPYNQTAGTTMGYYNALTNWGTRDNPLALLASDYDFHSMISADGTLRREEYIQARLLNGLLYTMGERLAREETFGGPKLRVRGDGRYQACGTGQETGGFTAIANLEGRAQVFFCQTETAEGEVAENFCVTLPALETVLLPYHLAVDSQCQIRWSNFELAFIREIGNGKQIVLYGNGEFIAEIEIDSVSRRICGEAGTQVKRMKIGNYEIVYGAAEQIARMEIPGIDRWSVRADGRYEAEEIETAEEAEERADTGCSRLQGTQACTAIRELERYGQYRGCGSYTLVVSDPGDYLISGLSGLVTVYRSGVFQESLYGDGRTVRMPLAKGEYRFETEIWGHCNFEDIRVPALHIGALKGIHSVCRIAREQDISCNWMLEIIPVWKEKLPESNSGPAFRTDIDSYNAPESPVLGSYTKELILWEDCEAYMLHFAGAECVTEVRVNGINAGSIQKGNHYLDITPFVKPGNRCVIELKVLRRYYADRVGPVTLIGGMRLEGCRYRDITFSGAHGNPTGIRRFPIPVEAGEKLILKPNLPRPGESGIRMAFYGKNLLLTVACGTHIVGRILLNADHMPPVAGGSPHELYLCRDWLEKGETVIQCRALAPGAVFEKLIALSWETERTL